MSFERERRFPEGRYDVGAQPPPLAMNEAPLRSSARLWRARHLAGFLVTPALHRPQAARRQSTNRSPVSTLSVVNFHTSLAPKKSPTTSRKSFISR